MLRWTSGVCARQETTKAGDFEVEGIERMEKRSRQHSTKSSRRPQLPPHQALDRLYHQQKEEDVHRGIRSTKNGKYVSKYKRLLFLILKILLKIKQD